MKTFEKNMTLSQQLGMVTLKNTLKVFADYAINFQLISKETDECITKKFTRLPLIDMVDANGELFMDAVTDIVFRLYKNDEAAIRFYNVHDEILEVDCFKGFEAITVTWVK